MGWTPNQIVDGFLLDKEIDLKRTRPDLPAWYFGTALPLSLFTLLVVYLALQSEAAAVRDLGVLFGVVMVVVVARSFARLWYTRYVLTNYRAMRVSGVLRNDCEWMSWGKVTDVTINRSLVDRMMRTATIQIHSANEDSGFRAMKDVPNPLDFARRITVMVNSRQGPVDLTD